MFPLLAKTVKAVGNHCCCCCCCWHCRCCCYFVVAAVNCTVTLVAATVKVLFVAVVVAIVVVVVNILCFPCSWNCQSYCCNSFLLLMSKWLMLFLYYVCRLCCYLFFFLYLNIDSLGVFLILFILLLKKLTYTKRIGGI